MGSFSAYRKSESDIRLLETVGDIVYTATVNTSTASYIVETVGVNYYLDGIQYDVPGSTLFDVTSGYSNGDLIYLYGDNTGTLAIGLTQPADTVLISTFERVDPGVDNQVNVTTGPLIDRIAGSIDHNSQPGLQGGSATQRYHLNENQHNAVAGTVTNVGSIIDYTNGSGSTVFLDKPYTNTDYHISLTFEVNIFDPDISYHAEVFEKDTGQFKVRIIKEEESGSTYIKDELPNTVFGDAAEPNLSAVSYVTTNQELLVGVASNVKEFVIENVSDGSLGNTTSGKTNGFSHVSFPTGIDSDIDFQFTVPDNYAPGTPMNLDLSYTSQDAVANNVKVNTNVYLHKKDSGTISSHDATTLIEETLALPGSAGTIEQLKTQIVSSLGSVSITPVGRGDIIRVNLSRDTSVGSNSTTNWDLITIKVRY
jgi:hypothetical protein